MRESAYHARTQEPETAPLTKRLTISRRAAVSAAALLCSTVAAAELSVGDAAPDWTLPATDGNRYTLSELRGQHVVIAFFPKAFTSG